jgi:hypothetical protein
MSALQVELLLNGLRDLSGEPLSGGKVYTYTGGTTTPAAMYTDRAATTPATNPIILNSYGRAQVYADGTFKLVIKDEDDVTLYTLDDLVFGTTEDPSLYAGAAGGSANALTLSPASAISAYEDGMEIVFRATAANTSTSVTVNVSGLGAKTILRKSTSAALAVGDIISGHVCHIVYVSSAGAFVLLNPYVAICKANDTFLDNGGGVYFETTAAAKHLGIYLNDADILKLNAVASKALVIRQGTSELWRFEESSFDFEPTNDDSREIGWSSLRLYRLWTKRIDAGDANLSYAVGSSYLHQFSVNGVAQFEIASGLVNFASGVVATGKNTLYGSKLKINVGGAEYYLALYTA